MIGMANTNESILIIKVIRFVIRNNIIKQKITNYTFSNFLFKEIIFFQINSVGSIQTFCLHDPHQVYVTDKEVFLEFFSLLLQSKQEFHVLAYCTHLNLIIIIII